MATFVSAIPEVTFGAVNASDAILHPSQVSANHPTPPPAIDKVEISQSAQVLALQLQGQTVSEIAMSLGITTAAVSADLGITTTAPKTAAISVPVVQGK